MGTPILKISSLILLDIEDQLRELQNSPDNEKQIWVWRSNRLICPMFFMVLHLEQSGQSVNPHDLADINRLDDLMAKTQKELGHYAVEIQCALSEALAIIPGYHVARKGNQEDSTQEHYGYILMSARRLWKAGRSQPCAA